MWKVKDFVLSTVVPFLSTDSFLYEFLNTTVHKAEQISIDIINRGSFQVSRKLKRAHFAEINCLKVQHGNICKADLNINNDKEQSARNTSFFLTFVKLV